MKKLVIKIGNETHELPYNGEAFSFEVSEKYVPKAGDCVMIESKVNNFLYWCKLTDVTKTQAYFKTYVNNNLKTYKYGFFYIDSNRIYTKITQEELKAKYAEAGYDWDYETNTIKPIKCVPKEGDKVWFLNVYMKANSITFCENGKFDKDMLEKGLLFHTKEECQKFANHCMEYVK